MIVMRVTRRCRGLFAAVRAWMPLFLEIAVTIASARMALLLTINQGYFENNPHLFYWLVAHFPQQEWKWAVLAGTASLFKALGMLLLTFRNSERAIEAAFVLRGIGWALSVVFWTTLAVSIQIADAWSLAAICCAVLAPFSFVALIMGPAMPEATNARYEG